MTHHFNNLTPAEAERLAMLAEECGEVIQIIGKILRHGYDSRHPDGGMTNRELLQREVCDVSAIVDAMQAHGDGISGDIQMQRNAWVRKLRYSHHQPHQEQPFK